MRTKIPFEDLKYLMDSYVYLSTSQRASDGHSSSQHLCAPLSHGLTKIKSMQDSPKGASLENASNNAFPSCVAIVTATTKAAIAMTTESPPLSSSSRAGDKSHAHFCRHRHRSHHEATTEVAITQISQTSSGRDQIISCMHFRDQRISCMHFRDQRIS